MFKGELKPYQVDAVNKMVEKKKILVAYQMGLGKTPMTIAAIEALRKTRDVEETVLVLCLASLKYQWQKEIDKFTGDDALVIDGSPAKRKEQYSQMKNYRWVIMNYEQVVNDWDIIKDKPIDAIVADEATAIKGFRAKRAKKVKELAKRVSVRFALTGTPIENGRPEEIYSIMQFVDPTVLGRFDLFDQTFIVRNHFGGVQRYRNLPTLHTKLSESSVRKTQLDDDVKPYLPDAVYREPLLVPADAKTKKVYNYIANDLLDLLTEASSVFGSNFSLQAHYGQAQQAGDPANEMRGHIMSRITALRMLCSNPHLLVKSAEDFDRMDSKKGSAYASQLRMDGWMDNLNKTPKLDAAIGYLMDHLDIDSSYKAVVFSSYLGSVDEIVKRLHNKGINAIAYTGEMNAREKEINKTVFKTDPNTRVLVSSDAGGYGVDLPEGNLLVNYDQPWSSGMAMQRNGRINRASSEWETITIQDILVKDSIEERQYDTLKQKIAVANAVIDGEGINSKGGVDLTVGSLISFLTPRIN
jgi:SNF2 family DNA or RNA helicase